MNKAFEKSDDTRLNQIATAFKKAGDMASAIKTLRKIKADSGDVYADTKLAKYLQSAGLFDESMREIQWLLDHSHAWAKALFGHQPVCIIQCQRAGWCARVHSAAALICKRSKQPELQAKHQEFYERYLSISRRLRPIGNADEKNLTLA